MRTVLLGLVFAIALIAIWQITKRYLDDFDSTYISSVESPDRRFRLAHYQSRTDTANHHAPYGDNVYLERTTVANEFRDTIFAGYCQEFSMKWADSKVVTIECTTSEPVRTQAKLLNGISVNVDLRTLNDA